MIDTNDFIVSNNSNFHGGTGSQVNQRKKDASLYMLFRNYIVPPMHDLNSTRELRHIMPILLKSKGNINYLGGSSRQTALHCFLTHYVKKMQHCSQDQLQKDSEIIETLLEKGASIVILDGDGNSPLGIAIVNGRLDLVQKMLQYSVNVNTRNSNGESFLHIVIDSYAERNDNGENYFDYVKIIHNLVLKGASLNLVNCTGMTPVHYAAKRCFVEILELFEQFGMNFDALTNSSDDLLMTMCSEIRQVKDTQAILKTIDLLLRKGCNPKHKNHHGLTCLHYAAQSKQLAILEHLIKAGADPKVITQDGITPLHIATMLGTSETVQYLLDHGVDPWKRDDVYGFTSLHTAALNGDPAILKLIVKRGLHLNDFCKNGLTTLQLACLFGNFQIVKELIKLGADVNCRDERGCYTPLHLSSIRGQLSITKGSLKIRWSRGCWMKKGLKLVKLQSELNCEVINELVRAGAEVNVKDASLRTPLHLASLQRNHDVVEALLKNGAFLDVRDNEGSLPLHNILNSGNLNNLRYMLEYGADVNDIVVPLDTFTQIMNRKKLILEVLLQHVVKLQAANLPINDLYKSYLDEKTMRNHRNKCLNEIKKLKNQNLTSTMSYYDLLKRNSEQKFTFIDSLPLNLETEFPIYFSTIRGRYKASCARNSLLQSAKVSFDYLTTVCWPDLCVEHIFSYLSNTDLRAVIDSIETNCF